MNTNHELVKANLSAVWTEVTSQPEVGAKFPTDLQSYSEQMEQIREYIEDAAEYGIAYESLVCLVEEFPFRLSGRAAVKLLETGLLMQFKTERPEDGQFDRRR